MKCLVLLILIITLADCPSRIRRHDVLSGVEKGKSRPDCAVFGPSCCHLQPLVNLNKQPPRPSRSARDSTGPHWNVDCCGSLGNSILVQLKVRGGCFGRGQHNTLRRGSIVNKLDLIIYDYDATALPIGECRSGLTAPRVTSLYTLEWKSRVACRG
jgi:hypothetical protein